jgi:hypothetical protein
MPACDNEASSPALTSRFSGRARGHVFEQRQSSSAAGSPLNARSLGGYLTAIVDLCQEPVSRVAARVAVRLLWCGRTPADLVYQTPAYLLPGTEQPVDDESAANELATNASPVEVRGTWSRGHIALELSPTSVERPSRLPLPGVPDPHAELICWFAGSGFRVPFDAVVESERLFHLQGAGFITFFRKEDVLQSSPSLPGLTADDLLGVPGVLVAGGEPVQNGWSAPLGLWPRPPS